MLDTLVKQIVPAPQEYPTMQAVARACAESGFPGLLAQIEADLRREPGSWTFEHAEEEAWLVTTEWRLDELWDYMRSSLSIVFYDAEVPPGDSVVPLPNLSGHPLRPTAACANCFPDDTLYDWAQAERWFLGEYWSWNSASHDYDILPPPEWSEYHGGTDLGLGMNVAINGKRYYYMGDTRNAASGPMWSRNDCDVDSGVRCDDMIVVSTDVNPNDGIDAYPILELQKPFFTTRWRPIVIPGVHKDISPALHDPINAPYWVSVDAEPTFTVPTGVVAAHLPFITDLPVPTEILDLPTVVLWYGTAIHPSAWDSTITFADADPTRSPKSWVGCSFDGIHFRACYTDTWGDAVPFSKDTAPYSTYPAVSDPGGESQYSGAPARFIQVAAVDLTASDFEALCSVDPDSAMCTLYDPGVPSKADGGLLLYGSGRPYRKSGLFLAFIQRNEFGQVDSFTGKPVVNYFWVAPDGTDSGWSQNEYDATPLTGDPPCDRYLQPNCSPTDHAAGGCWPDGTTTWSPDEVFGEISARLIRTSIIGEEPKIILLGNGSWAEDSMYPFNNLHWHYAWRTLLSDPAGGDFASLDYWQMRTAGYGPYIIGAFSDSMFSGGDIVLWHTISVWHGDGSTPYGVYSGSEVIPW